MAEEYRRGDKFIQVWGGAKPKYVPGWSQRCTFGWALSFEATQDKEILSFEATHDKEIHHRINTAWSKFMVMEQEFMLQEVFS